MSATSRSRPRLRSQQRRAAVILVLLLGVTVTAGEYRHGTITATFLVTPVRERVLVAKLIAALLLGFAFAVAGVVVNVLVGWLALQAKGRTCPRSTAP